MARTKHSGLRSRAGPKSRKRPAPATKAQQNTKPASTQVDSPRPQRKKLKLTPFLTLLLTTNESKPPQPQPQPPLPPELHRHILEHVQRSHDRPTLLSCGLVCRTWFQFCQNHIFRNIILKSLEQVNLVVECLSNPSSGVHLARSISVEQREDLLPWGHNVLLRLAGRLPNIQELIFDNCSTFQSGGDDTKAVVGKPPTETYCSHPSMPHLLPPLFSRFPNLTTLRLDLYCFRSLVDLLRVVGSLPKLHTLGCHRLSWKLSPGPESRSFPRPLTCPQLRSVTITRCPSVWPLMHFFDAPSTLDRGRLSQAKMVSPLVDATSATSPNSSSTQFPGLDCIEAQTLSEIGALYGLGSSSINPDLQIRCKRSKGSKTWILQIRDIYHIHELQFHLRPIEVPCNGVSPARIREIIFVSHSGLHRTGDVVPEEVGVLLERLAYLDRVVFDAAWDHAAEEVALAGFDHGLRSRIEVVLGAAAKAWRAASRNK